MKAWYNALQPRDRLIVLVTAILLLLILLYLIVWSPVASRLETTRQTVNADRSLLVWLQKNGAEIRQLRGSGNNSNARPTTRNISLINAVESSARQMGIRKSITHLEPKGDTGISVQIKAANFDQLIRWQGSMQQQYAAEVTQVTIKPTGESGLVDATIRFNKAGA